jgi:hypothetical protein
MTKLFTLLITTLISLSVEAQCSIFSIFSENNDKFTLFIDGEQINDEPSFRVADIKNSNEAVTFVVKFEDESIPDLKEVERLIDLENKHNKITFRITEKKGKYKIKVVSYEVYEVNCEDNKNYNSTATSSSSTNYSEDNQTSSSSQNEDTFVNNTDNSQSYSENNNTNSIANTSSYSSEAGNGEKIKLAYKWTNGKTYRFSANQVDNVTMSVMGMNQSDVYTTKTTFALKVTNILSNGSAEGMLYIENFMVTDGSGNIIASLKDIPDAALKSLVEVDTKGKFTFKKIVYMIVNGDDSNILVSAEAKDGKASGSAQMGDQKMTIHAEFDPKSGTLKAGYSIETVKKPAPKTVKVKEDAQRIDVLPLQFLDMLVLPEGEVYEGGSFTTKMMEYVFTTKAHKVENNIASLGLNIKTDRSNGSSNDMMDGMMSDMGGMDMSGSSPKTDLDGDINYNFNISKGIFNSLEGTMNNKIKGMGLDLKVTSKLKLKLIN